MRDLCAVAGYYVVLEECVFFFRDQAGNSFKVVGVCWQRWAELTGLAVSTSGCFGLHGLSRLLGKIVRMLPLGPER